MRRQPLRGGRRGRRRRRRAARSRRPRAVRRGPVAPFADRPSAHPTARLQRTGVRSSEPQAIRVPRMQGMGDHLIVLHSAVRACPGYDRHEAPSILLDGSSIARDTEHGRAVTAQLTRRHGTLEEAIEAGTFALSAAGLSKGIRRQARAACEDYFYSRLSLTPSYELGGREEIVEGLELMPDAMYRALEDIVELVVDGDYEELGTVSRDR